MPGRARADHGEYSGEEFREDVLEPALDRYDLVVVDLNGVFSFPASFVDEAFGVLVHERGLAAVKRKLTLKLDDNPVALRSIEDAMAGHAA